jgi:hypothetical protein
MLRKIEIDHDCEFISFDVFERAVQISGDEGAASLGPA